MFCPEDGTHIPYSRERDIGGVVYYPPCSACNLYYVYSDGAYETCTQEETESALVAARILAYEGAMQRELGRDIIAARILDTLEATAKNQITPVRYLLGHRPVEQGLAVARQTLAGKYTYTYTEYVGDWCGRGVTRIQAIRLLLEYLEQKEVDSGGRS